MEFTIGQFVAQRDVNINTLFDRDRRYVSVYRVAVFGQ